MTNPSNPVHVRNVFPDGTPVDFNNPFPVADASVLVELQKKADATEEQLVELNQNLELLMRIIANPAYVDKSANQMRSQVTGSLTTVTTVTTVTGLTNIDSFAGRSLITLQNQQAWGLCVRNLIT